jgi:hypothetical protein
MVAHLHGYGHHMEFIQYLEGADGARKLLPSMRGVAHACLQVADIDRTWEELLAAGATAQGNIAEVSVGPAAGCKAGYIRDPGGIIIELLEVGVRTD